MNRIIYKYVLWPEPTNNILIPRDGKIISIQIQNDKPVMWVLVDPIKPEIKRTFEIIPTGLKFDYDCKEYIGTFQVDGGSLVFHVFEVKNE